MWLTIAASRSTGAERELIVTARDAVAVRMTPTDLREAERRAQAWHAAHQDMRNRAAPPSDTGREGLIIALGSCHRANTGRLQSLIGRFGANVEKRLDILRAF